MSIVFFLMSMASFMVYHYKDNDKERDLRMEESHRKIWNEEAPTKKSYLIWGVVYFILSALIKIIFGL
jgi:hypothetical protein